jgi:hypothetical protein
MEEIEYLYAWRKIIMPGVLLQVTLKKWILGEAPRPQAGASRKGMIIFNCAPSPRLSRQRRDGACGARSGQGFIFNIFS